MPISLLYSKSETKNQAHYENLYYEHWVLQEYLSLSDKEQNDRKCKCKKSETGYLFTSRKCPFHWRNRMSQRADQLEKEKPDLPKKKCITLRCTRLTTYQERQDIIKRLAKRLKRKSKHQFWASYVWHLEGNPLTCNLHIYLTSITPTGYNWWREQWKDIQFKVLNVLYQPRDVYCKKPWKERGYLYYMHTKHKKGRRPPREQPWKSLTGKKVYGKITKKAS